MTTPARVPAYRVQDDALQVLLSFPQGCTNKDEVLQDLARDLLDARAALRLGMPLVDNAVTNKELDVLFANDTVRGAQLRPWQRFLAAARAALPEAT